MRHDDTKQPTGADVVRVARAWVGTHYMHQQRTKGRACDCVGLIIGVAKCLGIGDYHGPKYSMTPDPDMMGVLLRDYLEEVSPGKQLAKGDIIWLVIRREPQHLAIVADYPLGGWSMIHAHSSADRVVEHRIDERWASRIHAVFRFPGLAAEHNGRSLAGI